MTPGEFIETFDIVAEAPGGIERLRELVLQLAVRGKLVPQDEGEESPISILERNAKKKRCLADQRKISNPKSLPHLSLDKVPFSAPETWQWIRLGDVALVVMGNSPPGSSYNEQGLGVPLINGPVEFSTGAFGLTICRKYTTKPNQMCMIGDMLICVRGATTGRTNIAAFDACIGRGVALVRAWDAQQYVNLYLWYVGKELLAAGKGTTFPSISYADLAGKPLPLPPLAEQHRIVAKVDELMGLIDRLAAARRSREAVRVAGRDSALAALRNAAIPEEVGTAWMRIAERMDDLFTAPADLAPLRWAVLQLAVRGRLVPQEAGDEPSSELLKRITAEKARLVKDGKIKKQKLESLIKKNEPPFDLPIGWSSTRLAFITVCLDYMRKPISETERTQRTAGKSQAELFPYFGATRQQGWIDDYIFDEELVLLGEDGVPFFDPLRPKAYLIKGKSWVNNHAHVFRGIFVSHSYLLYWLNTFDYSGRVAGTTRSKLNQARALDIPIMLPPLAEQHRIVAKIDELMGLIDRLEQHLVAKENHHTAFAAATNVV